MSEEPDLFKTDVELLQESHDKVRRKVFAEIGEIKKRMEALEASMDVTHRNLVTAAETIKWREGKPEEVIAW